ncbi:MAG: hypothetical protein KDB31_06555, partial [Microthrixaceae bacterium]|nr:hypothetical protein [Microthrixaceae bacterium]
LVNRPKDYDTIDEALARAGGWALSETARVVTDTSPATTIVERIIQLLAGGRAHLTTAEGGVTTGEAALSWGWHIRADATWHKGGERVGYVTYIEGMDEPCVAFNSDLLATAINRAFGGRLTASQVDSNLRRAVGSDRMSVVVPTGNRSNQLRITEHQARYLLVRPEAIGVDTSQLAKGKGIKRATIVPDEQQQRIVIDPLIED